MTIQERIFLLSHHGFSHETIAAVVGADTGDIIEVLENPAASVPSLGGGRGEPNGIATLDGDGQVPVDQLGNAGGGGAAVPSDWSQAHLFIGSASKSGEWGQIDLTGVNINATGPKLCTLDEGGSLVIPNAASGQVDLWILHAWWELLVPSDQFDGTNTVWIQAKIGNALQSAYAVPPVTGDAFAQDFEFTTLVVAKQFSVEDRDLWSRAYVDGAPIPAEFYTLRLRATHINTFIDTE